MAFFFIQQINVPGTGPSKIRKNKWVQEYITLQCERENITFEIITDFKVCSQRYAHTNVVAKKRDYSLAAA